MTLGRIDRYELLQLIGQGSFGGVYRARHVHTGQIHALKLARDSVDPDGASRVLAEARAAASLRHPNVVGVIDGGVAPTGEAFIVMELLEGRTLADLIAREGPLPPARVVRIARQMLEALGAAHQHGIVHRDIKPSNVFVTSADQTGGDVVKVIDFGISKVRTGAHESGMTLPGMAMGTPGYMAPEQLGDARSVDARADLYAIGATMFEMLTKRKPIEAETFEAWMRRLVTERAPPLSQVAPHVPPALAAVVDRALARDLDGRWPSALAMREALDQASAIPHDGYAPTEMGTPPGLVQNLSSPGSGNMTPAPYAQRPTAPLAPLAPSNAPYGAPLGGPPMGPPPFAPPPPFSPPATPGLHGPHASHGPPMMMGPVPATTVGPARGPSIVLWLVAGSALLLLLAGGGVAAYLLTIGKPEPDAATAPPPATAAATTPAAPLPGAPPPATATTTPGAGGKTPPGKVAPAPNPAPSPPPTPSAVPSSAPAPAPAPGSKTVRITPPRIIGDLRQDAFMGLANRARPAVEQCNPDRRALTVKVDVMIGQKKITIAQPSVNTSPGDPLIARCVAQSLKDAQSAAFTPGDSGIYQEAQFSW